MKNDILMQKVSLLKKQKKDVVVFNNILDGFKKFSKADHYVVGYIKDDVELLIYKIPTEVFYKLANKLLYLNNSSDKNRTLSLRLYRYSEKRINLIKDYYVDSFSIKELENYKGNQGFRFESFVESQYKLTHNTIDDIENGGIDSKRDGTNYQVKLEAASMKMFRLWYECNDLFIDNGWV